MALWTLVEYVLHRFVLHHVPYIKEAHDAHHEDQLALIGTPIWISLSIMVVFVLMPLSLVVEQHVAIGLACGLMFGHIWYGGVHHILHHWKIEPGSYLYRLKRHHMLHHHFDENGQFRSHQRLLGRGLRNRPQGAGGGGAAAARTRAAQQQ